MKHGSETGYECENCGVIIENAAEILASPKAWVCMCCFADLRLVPIRENPCQSVALPSVEEKFQNFSKPHGFPYVPESVAKKT
jgi:hypothetical protein